MGSPKPVEPNLAAMPPEILKIISKDFDLETVQHVRKVCHRLRHFIDSSSFNFNIKHVTIQQGKNKEHDLLPDRETIVITLSTYKIEETQTWPNSDGTFWTLDSNTVLSKSDRIGRNPRLAGTMTQDQEIERNAEEMRRIIHRAVRTPREQGGEWVRRPRPQNIPVRNRALVGELGGLNGNLPRWQNVMGEPNRQGFAGPNRIGPEGNGVPLGVGALELRRPDRHGFLGGLEGPDGNDGANRNGRGVGGPEFVPGRHEGLIGADENGRQNGMLRRGDLLRPEQLIVRGGNLVPREAGGRAGLDWFGFLDGGPPGNAIFQNGRPRTRGLVPNTPVIPLKQYTITYIDNEEGCFVEYGRRSILLVDVNFAILAANDLIRILKYQTDVLENFETRFSRDRSDGDNLFGDELDEYFKSRGKSLLKVKNFEAIGTNDEQKIMKLLGHFDPVTLDTISLKIEHGDENQSIEMEQLVELEQWKQSKRLKMIGLNKSVPILHFHHFVDASFSVEQISAEDLASLKEATLRNPESKFSVYYETLKNLRNIPELLGRPNRQNHPFENRVWCYAIPDSHIRRKIEWDRNEQTFVLTRSRHGAFLM